MKLVRHLGIVAGALTLAVAALVLPARAADVTDGTLVPTSSVRVLDTRIGQGAARQPVRGGTSIAVQVLGRGGIPSSEVSAVVATLTAVGPTVTGSYLTVYPDGTARPAVSALNLVRGEVRANTVTVPVGEEGKIRIFNSTGATHVLLDVVAYYQGDGTTAPGSELYPTDPTRILDTRTDEPLNPSDGTFVDFDFGSAELNESTRAVAVNLTAVTPEREGYLTAWDGTGDPPATSNLNFSSKSTVANYAVVAVSACGDFCTDPSWRSLAIRNASPGRTNVLIDLVGVYAESTDGAGLRFEPITPIRIVDTRRSFDGPKLGANQARSFAPGPAADGNTVALAGNVTAVSPTTSTYLTVYDYEPRPGVSTLNARPFRATANAALIPLRDPDDYAVKIYNRSGNLDVIVDVAGMFVTRDTAAATARPRTQRHYAVHHSRSREAVLFR